MGGAASISKDVTTRDAQFSNVDGTKFSVKLAEKGYPVPWPATKCKKDIFHPKMITNATQYISSQMEDSILEEYDDLLSFLTSECLTDLHKLCNVFTFLGLYYVNKRNLDTNDKEKVKQSGDIARESDADCAGISTADDKDIDSPKVYMKSIQKGVGRFAFFFTILCRKAGLPCVLIPGIAKSATYVVGDTNLSKLRNVWTAVYVDGDWRFVHPLWAIKTLYGYKNESWYLVDTSGNITVDETQTNEETSYGMNTFWFLTDADHFINWCFPDDQQWQLLGEPQTTHQFVQQLYRRETFFNMGLRIENHEHCHLLSSSGLAEIILRIPKSITTFVIIYDLFRKSQQITNIPNSDIRHCIAMVKDFPFVSFRMRFPVADSFILNLYGSDIGISDTLDWLCSFRIDCTHAMKTYIPYPESPYTGWGAGFETEAAGLKPLSHTSGLVITNKSEPIIFEFRLLKSVSVIADLLELSTEYKPKVMNFGKNSVRVVVSLPNVNREYGLALYTKNAKDNSVKNAVNYLIRREVDGFTEMTNYRSFEEYDTNATDLTKAKWKKMQRKVVVQDESNRCRKLKMKMSQASVTEDIFELEQAVQLYENNEYPSCMELSLAIKQLQYLHRKQALQKAMKLKQTQNLEKAINDIKEQGDMKKISTTLIKTAESLLLRLRLLDRSRERVSDLNNRNVNEVRRYNRAVKTVHEMVAAVYALLGETPSKLQEWKYVQSLLGRDGAFSVIHLVETCRVSDLTDSKVAACKVFLGEHTMNECHAVSTEIAVFFQWVTSMIDSFESTSVN